MSLGRARDASPEHVPQKTAPVQQRRGVPLTAPVGVGSCLQLESIRVRPVGRSFGSGRQAKAGEAVVLASSSAEAMLEEAGR